MNNKPGKASEVFSKIINEYPETKEAVFAFSWLMRCFYENEVDTAYNYVSGFEKKYGVDKNKESYGLYEASLPVLAASYFAQGDNDNGLATYDKIVKEFPGTENAKYSLYNKLLYYINNEGDISKANTVYAQLKSSYPNDPVLVDALILLVNNPTEMLKQVTLAQQNSSNKKLNKDGNIQKSDVDNIVVKEFALEQNYPNPFNPSTIIQYQIPINGNVKITVYDVLGRKVEDLVNEYQGMGIYRVTFNVDNLSSGVYYYSIFVDGAGGRKFINTKKMMILK